MHDIFAFLFVCLFVINTIKGECGEPKLYPFTSYTLDEKDPYSLGSAVTYRCARGYSMMGDDDYVNHTCGISNINQTEWRGPLVRCYGMDMYYHRY